MAKNWAKNIESIANKYIKKIYDILENSENNDAKNAFFIFEADLKNMNPNVSQEEIVEMLAQHILTKPIFESLFGSLGISEKNLMSKAMNAVLDAFKINIDPKYLADLEPFYFDVKKRAEKTVDPIAKQNLIMEIYNDFFLNAFPKTARKLGMVYTPVEVVDFIIHSVNDILQNEFGKTLGDEGVKILDPFTGGGLFITRLLQSGLITKEQLPYKYENEIEANEIFLLAYYIASINIELVYHDIMGGEYQPFKGLSFTDTFRKSGSEDLEYSLMKIWSNEG